LVVGDVVDFETAGLAVAQQQISFAGIAAKMALVVWRTGAWKLEIVKRSDAVGFEVLPSDGLSQERSPGSLAIAVWLAISNARPQRSSRLRLLAGE
jgi:hypothetical protein